MSVPRELLTPEEIARGVRVLHELSPSRQAEVKAAAKARPAVPEFGVAVG